MWRIGSTKVTVTGILTKAAAVGFGALVIGGGNILLNVNKDNAVQDQKIEVLERTIIKIDEMDRTLRSVDGNVRALDGNVRVLDTKLNDMKEQLNRRPR